MKSIQKISEQLILSLYLRQRKYGYVTDEIISFTRLAGEITAFVQTEELELAVEDEDFENILIALSRGSDTDLLNAFEYLRGKGLIKYDSSGSTSIDFEIYNIGLTSAGIDIIEGVDGAHTDKKNYQVTFNVKLENNINLESLFKAELGSIFKLI